MGQYGHVLSLLGFLLAALLIAAGLAAVRSVVDDTEQIDRTAERLFGHASPGRLDGQE